jgi:hypothetical protein
VQFAVVGLRLGNSFTTTAKVKLFTQNADFRSNTALRRAKMIEILCTILWVVCIGVACWADLNAQKHITFGIEAAHGIKEKNT